MNSLKKYISFLFTMIAVLIVGVFAMAQVATGTPLPVPGEAAISFLDKMLALIPSDGGAIVVIAGILDFGLRLAKTEKPLSILWMISKFMHKIASLFEKLSVLLDKVLPQNSVQK